MPERKRKQPDSPETIRCAIYTRKSTEEGLEQEFNSLDAQRESAEAYITSQKSAGWVCLETRYDDGGFTGGNTDRPALKRLLADIAAGEIDIVIVYKVDRLSRSLTDFTRVMETFDRHGVSFVSVTQQFNTTSSMGRLTLNILLSFAQFEREIISERTRDKMAAARRKGRYIGGPPLLGYDIDRERSRLVVNEAEAEQVRAIFALYLEKKSLLATLAEVDQRGWSTKVWTTKKGVPRGGLPFDKSRLHKLLTNVAYLGQVTYRDEVHAGLHEAIVDGDTFQQVQNLLRANRVTNGGSRPNTTPSLLNGLIRCAPCQCAMGATHTRKRDKRYRYYTCVQAQKRGWATCPSKAIPAAEIEAYVVDQIRRMGQSPELASETIAAVRKQQAELASQLTDEQTRLQQTLASANRNLTRELQRPEGPDIDRLAALQEEIQQAESALIENSRQRASHQQLTIPDEAITQALEEFDRLWEHLSLAEQSRILHLLIEQIAYDGRDGSVAITLRPSGLEELLQHTQPEETHA